MVCESTLKVKNLPKDLSDTEKEEFLRHFGATNVKLITSQCKSKCVAFAKFESKEVAKAVLFRLHQLTVLNRRLSVVYAEYDIGQGKSNSKSAETAESCNKKHFKTFINKITAWNSAVSFNQPPPGHLKYVYPKANRATINNIAHALASIPKFYTQVLHLMNRMNLPPPFSNVPDPPQVTMRQAPLQKMHTAAPERQEDSEESELESDPEASSVAKEILPTKRSQPQRKAIKKPRFIKPPPLSSIPKVTTESMEHVFERNNFQQQKQIKVKKVTADCLEAIAVKDSPILDVMKETSRNSYEEEQKTVITAITEQELESNRIPFKDLGVLPVFKEYHPGIPSSRLYVKNIAKTVEKCDLEHIFKRYQTYGIEKTMFDIKLMQEGRMKGQAFVTLDSVQLAQQAVKETNGFILRDKPLVVVFAKTVQKKLA